MLLWALFALMQIWARIIPVPVSASTAGFFPRGQAHSRCTELGVALPCSGKAAGCDVIFVDPGNGLIVSSANGTPKSNKFVLPQELAEYNRSGASVIYYQHKARLPDNFYLTQHKELLNSGAFPSTIGAGLKFISTAQRYYFFIVQPQHTVRVESDLANMMKTDWVRYFKPF